MLSRLKRDLTMAEAARAPGGARVDLLLVAEMVAPGSKVLDIGAGDGELLRILGEQRGVDGRGIELSREGVNECVAKGLAVIQGDADTDLADYPNDAFDYVILSQTLQATRQPRVVLEHMLRIGRNAVVSFPNFGHWKIRLQLLFGGHMPSTDNLPYAWWDSPNIHFCTIKDFVVLCDVTGAKMERAVAFNAWGTPLRFNAPWWFWNLFGEQAVFLLSRQGLRNEVPRLRVRWVWSRGRSTNPPIVETDIPARLDRLPWSRFHTLVVAALGITWILDGLEVTLGGLGRGRAEGKPGPAVQQRRRRPRRQRLSRRRGAGRAVLRLADRPARPQEALLHHACRSISSPRRRPRCRGISGASRCSAFSPARASAANMPRSTRPSRSSSPRACAAGTISSSTAASGSARRSARSAPSCCSIRR